MSENTRSTDPVIEALLIERDIAKTLQDPNNKARQEVRTKMEAWMSLLNDRKISKQYEEELGELNPEEARMDMLCQISRQFPKIAKELGWTPEMEKQLASKLNAGEQDAGTPHYDMAA
ncbi:MAG TPA: hypothetical protein VHA78_01845 [Candidatus Peribacteraceae bacterium]|nr:hypothetical protein [Candidatus Peribacteraceae bacterium]